MWAWIMILVCQIRYRAKADRGELPQSTFKAPGAPCTSWFALLFIGMVIVMMGVDKDARISLYCAPLWGLILGVSYLVLKSRNPRGRGLHQALSTRHGRRRRPDRLRRPVSSMRALPYHSSVRARPVCLSCRSC